MSKIRDFGQLMVDSRNGTEELSVEWKIPNFPSLTGGSDDYYESHQFRIGHETWRLRLWPNWNRQTQNPGSGWLVLSLKRRDLGPSRTFHYSVAIRGPKERVVKAREGEKEFSENDYYCIWNDFCSRSYLMKHRTSLMRNGVLKIRCILKRTDAARKEDILQRSGQNVSKSGEDSEATLKEQGLEELQSSLKSLLRSGEGSDVTIMVQGRKFRAHRWILGARSPVFRAMFAHDMAEKQSGIVTIEDIEQENFPHFLEHIYTGSVEMISPDNVSTLFNASLKYNLKILKKACAEFLKKNLSVVSFCDTFTLAVKYDDRELIGSATEFFCNNSLNIVQTAEWQMFLAENPTVGNELYIKRLKK